MELKARFFLDRSQGERRGTFAVSNHPIRVLIGRPENHRRAFRDLFDLKSLDDRWGDIDNLVIPVVDFAGAGASEAECRPCKNQPR